MKKRKAIKKEVLTFNAVFLEEPDGGYSASVPALPGCFSQGDTFEKAVKNVTPALEVKSRRIGGANYQVPQPVRPERKMQLAFRWIINAAKSKKGKPMAAKLAEELILASKNEGTAIKKKLDTHRMAEANRAFAHFSW